MLGAGVETREGRDTLLVTTGPPWKVLDEDAYIDRESLRQACSGEWRLRWWTTAFSVFTGQNEGIFLGIFSSTWKTSPPPPFFLFHALLRFGVFRGYSSMPPCAFL